MPPFPASLLRAIAFGTIVVGGLAAGDAKAMCGGNVFMTCPPGKGAAPSAKAGKAAPVRRAARRIPNVPRR